MTRTRDIILTASAPVIWGSTYIVTTNLLPADYPLTVAMLRALPAGILLMIWTRQFPPLKSIGKLLVLGALNFAVFWAALFVAAYRLPGGVAATLGAVQPLIVLYLAHLVLAERVRPHGVVAALAGIVGVGLLVLGPQAELDAVGMAAAVIGAGSMALGVVLTRKWRPDVPALTFTAWQLVAGGLLLVPPAILFEPALPKPDLANIAGFLWLGLPGAAISYLFWFRGIAILGTAAVTGLGFLSPLTAILLGWGIRGETLTPIQLTGAIIVLISVWLGSRPSSPVVFPKVTSKRTLT